MAAKNSNTISVKTLKELLDYDPQTGALTWKERHLKYFKDSRACKIWNTRYAGMVAGWDRGGGYLKVGILGRQFYAHRVAFAIHNNRWPEQDVDHLDGDGFNNRPENIREVKHSINGRNAKLRKDSTSGHVGVHWYSAYGKWLAHIRINGKQKNIGYFEHIEDAISARKQAQIGHGFTERHGT